MTWKYPEYLTEARKQYDAAIDKHLAIGATNIHGKTAAERAEINIAADFAYEQIREAFRAYEKAKIRFQSEGQKVEGVTCTALNK
jgi:hypothetical protein